MIHIWFLPKPERADSVRVLLNLPWVVNRDGCSATALTMSSRYLAQQVHRVTDQVAMGFAPADGESWADADAGKLADTLKTLIPAAQGFVERCALALPEVTFRLLEYMSVPGENAEGAVATYDGQPVYIYTGPVTGELPANTIGWKPNLKGSRYTTVGEQGALA